MDFLYDRKEESCYTAMRSTSLPFTLGRVGNLACLIFLFMTVLLMAFSASASAQDLKVRSVAVAEGDLSASVNRRTDRNGALCGLVKVQLPASGATFESPSIIGSVDFRAGEYWAYMTPGGYLMEIKHPSYHPLFVDLSKYDIRVESLVTYKLVIDLPTGVGSIEKFTVNGVSFNMVRVEGGTFSMGNDNSDPRDGKPVHQVTLNSYSIGETEVTQELWETVMGKNPSNFKGSNLPVENVSWNDCQEFIKQLNEKTGRSFRLPTEAEWEFAARGGNRSKGYEYSGSNNIGDVAWYWENSGDKPLSVEWNFDKINENHPRTHPVKTKQANELGLYDMSGNVWEWCQDWYGSYKRRSQTNPTGSSSGSSRVYRGGGWSSLARDCRSTFRCSDTPSFSNYGLGLRLAL